MGSLPGANSRVGRMGSRRQIQQLDAATLFRLRALLSQSEAVVRDQFTRLHRRYDIQCRTPVEMARGYLPTEIEYSMCRSQGPLPMRPCRSPLHLVCPAARALPCSAM